MRIFEGMCVFLLAGAFTASAFAQEEYSAVANQPAPVFPRTEPYHIAGKKIQLRLQVGRPGQEVQKLFGITGVLRFTGAQHLDYVENSFSPGSFLGNDVIFFPPRVDGVAGEITFAITRKSGAGGVNGSGEVASLQLVSSPATPDSLPVTLSLQNVAAIDSAGNRVELAPEDVEIFIVQPRDFALEVVPDSAAVIQGDTADFAVNVSQANLFEQPVALAIEPAFVDITPVWSAQTILPGSAVTLRLVTTENTPTGVYDFTISGTSGALVHSDTIRLRVNEKPDFDFEVRIEPEARILFPGDSASFSISVLYAGNVAEKARLAISGLETYAWLQSELSPAIISRDETATLKLKTSLAAPEGKYAFSVTAIVDSLQRQATASLVVAERRARVMPSPFTPNHDGANDVVKFYHKELQTGAGEILIFDLNGRKIRHLHNKRKWDGKDNNGNDARPGAYLFLVLVDGKMIDKGIIGLIR